MGAPLVEYESGQVSKPFEEMSDSGNQTKFTASFSPISRASGFEPVVAPYGLKTGGIITPGSSNDEVDVAALTVVAPGMSGADADGVVTVSAGTVSASRGVSTDTHRITSITVDSSGSLTAVAGVDGTSFSETRGADGGPPLIPVGSIEIGQVRTDSVTAAAITSGEIFQVPGTHQERSDFPVWTVDYASGEITFVEALPQIHTGTVTKKVYIKGATPVFAPVPGSADFQAADESASISSVETHDGAEADVTFALGTCTFTSRMTQADAISGDFVSKKKQNLWFRHRPDRDVTYPRQLTQGYLALSRAYPTSGGKVTIDCTVAAESATVDQAS